MTDRLKLTNDMASWRLMVGAAIEGAKRIGYELKRQPGRGLSNTYDGIKDGKTSTVSVRTTRDRWFAYQPVEGGTRWKTLDEAELVLVSAVDDPADPRNVDVYLFPADEVRKRFDASYAARSENGHTMRDGYGMWVKLDAGDPSVPSQVGAGLADDYPAIARFSLDELEASAPPQVVEEIPVPLQEEASQEEAGGPALSTVADVLTFARERIAELTKIPADAIKLDLRMGV
jgi:hypothetical protein